VHADRRTYEQADIQTDIKTLWSQHFAPVIGHHAVYQLPLTSVTLNGLQGHFRCLKPFYLKYLRTYSFMWTNFNLDVRTGIRKRINAKSNVYARWSVLTKNFLDMQLNTQRRYYWTKPPSVFILCISASSAVGEGRTGTPGSSTDQDQADVVRDWSLEVIRCSNRWGRHDECCWRQAGWRHLDDTAVRCSVWTWSQKRSNLLAATESVKTRSPHVLGTLLRWPSLAESVRSSVGLSVCLSRRHILAVASQGTARDAASVHFGPTIRTDKRVEQLQGLNFKMMCLWCWCMFHYVLSPTALTSRLMMQAMIMRVL